MYGEETDFEKSMRDFEAVENDSNKNVDEQEEDDLVGKFGVFGYDVNDENVYYEHYDTEAAAKESAEEFAQEIDGENLAYVEVWQADEEGRFGVSGEPIWKRSFEDELAKEESKTNEQEEVKEE